MSKELEYEFNNFADLLHKDCMNLMECLKKQDKDNKPILYLGKHFKKVILPYEEYQKMCNRLESIDNANPSEALECLKHIKKYYIPEPCSAKTYDCLETIEQALIKAEKEHKALEIIKKFIWVEDDKLICGRFGDIEIELEEEDFENKEEFNLLKEVLE